MRLAVLFAKLGQLSKTNVAGSITSKLSGNAFWPKRHQQFALLILWKSAIHTSVARYVSAIWLD